jgi:hypothetical protein
VKNRLVTMAGALAILALLGKFYATPVMAQALRAVLVKNLDEKGRSPYMQFQGRSCPGGGNAVCDIVFPPVPAGKRLVVERVNGSVIFASSGVRIASLLTPQNVIFFFPVRPTDLKVTSDPIVLVNESTLAYFESGEFPTFHLIFNDGSDVPVISSTISGYLVDL